MANTQHPVNKTFQAAITFAGEQRDLARNITRQLSPVGYSIFYDDFNPEYTLGVDLSELFHEIYSKTPLIIMIVSVDYIKKPWTRLERRSAVQNSLDNPDNRIVQVKVEDVNVPGIPTLFGYYDYDGDLNKLCSTIAGMLGPRPIVEPTGSGIQAKEILRICFRRSIFSSMANEISTQLMFQSIRSCIAQLHHFLPDIPDTQLSQYVKSIINDLDKIDRYSTMPHRFQYDFDNLSKLALDSLKIQIIDKLYYLNSKFALGVDLPNDVSFDYQLTQQYHMKQD